VAAAALGTLTRAHPGRTKCIFHALPGPEHSPHMSQNALFTPLAESRLGCSIWCVLHERVQMKIKRVSNMRDKVRHGNDIDFNSKILVMGKIDIFICQVGHFASIASRVPSYYRVVDNRGSVACGAGNLKGSWLLCRCCPAPCPAVFAFECLCCGPCVYVCLCGCVSVECACFTSHQKKRLQGEAPTRLPRWRHHSII